MITGFQAMAYMKAKGSAQGTFAEDKSRAGKDRTLCLSVGFRGEVPHDVRGGKRSTTHHKPVSIVHLWSPATVQFMTALWANETLEPNEPVAVICRRKSLVQLSLVLEYPFAQIASYAYYAYIESVTPAGHDVSKIIAFLHGETILRVIDEKQPQVLRLPSLRYGRSG